MAAAILVIALVVFAAGAVTGAFILVTWGSAGKAGFYADAPGTGQLIQGTRRVTGLSVRQTTDAPRRPTREDMFVWPAKAPAGPAHDSAGLSFPHRVSAAPSPGHGAARCYVPPNLFAAAWPHWRAHLRR